MLLILFLYKTLDMINYMVYQSTEKNINTVHDIKVDINKPNDTRIITFLLTAVQ